MDPQIDALQAVPLFAGLDRERLRQLVVRSVTNTRTAGSVLAVYGEPARYLLVAESGAVSAVRETADGRRLRLGEFAAPCAVDKSAVLDGGVHTATWLAASRTRLRLVPAGALLALVDDVAAVRRHVLALLSRQAHERQEELVRHRLADVTTRTAAWLVREAGRTGSRGSCPARSRAWPRR